MESAKGLVMVTGSELVEEWVLETGKALAKGPAMGLAPVLGSVLDLESVTTVPAVPEWQG